MWECPECGEELEDGFDSCWKCANEGVEIDREVSGGLPDVSDVVFVTECPSGGTFNKERIYKLRSEMRCG